MSIRHLSFAAAMAAITAIGAALAAPVQAGPISFNSALTLSSKEFVFRELFVFEDSGDDPSGQDRDRHALSSLSVLGYGVDETLALFAVVPFHYRRLRITTDGERRTRDATGLGDIRLFGKYTAVRRNWTARAFRLSPFAGIELPTGASDENDRFGRLPASVQLGSGSFDPFGGITATYQTLDYQIDAQLSYQANTEANNFEFGDVARADISGQLRLLPRKITGGVPGFLYGVLELNLIHGGKNRDNGAAVGNSGGVTLFVTPGLQYVTRRWILEAVVQLPVIQNLNGTALEKSHVVRAGIRVNF
ncbi:MAG: transporter [Alphaproteobacteria bacterium]